MQHMRIAEGIKRITVLKETKHFSLQFLKHEFGMLQYCNLNAPRCEKVV